MTQVQLEAFASGNRDAADLFFKTYGGIIRSIVNSLCHDNPRMNASDLFGDCITYILEHKTTIIYRFKGESRFSTYLYTICRYFCIREIKRSKKHGEFIDTMQYETPLHGEELIFDEHRINSVRVALKSLKHGERSFIQMHFFDKRPTKELMLFFNLNNVNSVYSRKNRIINRLQKIIKKNDVRRKGESIARSPRALSAVA